MCLSHNTAQIRRVVSAKVRRLAANQDCRLTYNRAPTPKQMQTLVQVWKQLRKWRS
jgi:hypothetical protein